MSFSHEKTYPKTPDGEIMGAVFPVSMRTRRKRFATVPHIADRKYKHFPTRKSANIWLQEVTEIELNKR